MNAMAGRMVGNYRIVGKLGEGGMGTVYRAIDTMVEREVALKALRPEIAAQPEVLERFHREAVVLARLNHPAIAQLYTFFKDGNDFYMVMEYVAGQTLEQWIKERGALPWSQAAAFAIQTLEGIGHAHSLNILHRDMKPANIIVTPSGRLKLMDFGIAQALGGARLTREGRIVGTLEYLAPERVQGKPADMRSDLYSVGVVLYEMLSGRLPFEGASDYELLLAQVQKQPPAPRELGIELPPEVEAVVMRSLEKDPDLRYPDAASFAAALSALTPAAATPAEPATKPELKPTRLAIVPAETPRAAASPRLSMKTTALAATAALLLVAAVAVLWPRRAVAPAPQPEAAKPVARTMFPPEPEAPLAPMPLPVQAAPVIPFRPVETGVKTIPVRPAAPKSAVEKPAPLQPVPAPMQATPPPTPPALTAEARRAAVAALEGPDAGPIGLNGILAALRVGGVGITAEVAGPVASRGVNFQVTPANEEALRAAGATPELIRLIAASYTAPVPAIKPVPAASTAARTLADVRSVYVERTTDGMDGYIKDEMRKQLGSLMRLVDSPVAADGIVRVTMEAQKGGAVSGTARVLGIKDRALLRVAILDPVSGRVLWEQGTGDRKPVIGAFRAASPATMAERVVRELKQDFVNRQAR